MTIRRVFSVALVAIVVLACLIHNSEAGKLKKIAKLAILGKALAPKIIPIPIPIHFSGGHSYHHHDPWAGYGGGHGGGYGGGHGGGYGGGFGGGFGGGYGGGFGGGYGGGWW